MSGPKPTEKRFEDHIEAALTTDGYSSSNFGEYDRNLCFIPSQVIAFIKSTQLKEWNNLTTNYGKNAEEKILNRIASEISRRGIIDVLRNQIVDRGIYLNLCYFKPKSDLNPDHQEKFRANKFNVVRQLYYSEENQNSIDMVLFLNGLPIVTIELKNQLTGQNYKHSEYQYSNDRDPKERLLKFKRCMVHFCVDNDKVSMATKLAGSKTVFLPFNQGLENPPVKKGYRTQYLWDEILSPSSILDIIENFVHVSKEKEFYYDEKIQKLTSKTKELLVFPRFHQLDLINKIRNQVMEDEVGKSYLIQHATGSGKSYSIGWLAHALTSLYKAEGDTKRLFDTIIVVTDRTVLDNQLQNTIQSLGNVEGVVNGVNHGSAQLKKFLEQGKDIVITTIQKFPFISESISALGDKNFAVIIDEVHSSQSGQLTKELKKSLSKSDDIDEFDYEEILRKEIKARGKQEHISFFGFTGTPKEKTLEIFGTKTKEGEFIPFHSYSMYQSIHEGFTLDVLQNYTTYERYFKVIKTVEEDLTVLKAKSKRDVIKFVDSHEMTITNKVKIILDHWVNKGSKEIKSKARGMIVTQSRENCVKYFREINKQLEERNISYRCLLGFSDEITIDSKKFTEASCNRIVGHEGDVTKGIKNPNFRLLVVANKFQTGFDEPLMQSMYIDKKLEGVQCVQTLSRLNRKTLGKKQTFVLDFVNQPEGIGEAFQSFYQSTILDGETDPNQLYNLLSEIYAMHLYTHEDVNRFCEAFFVENRDDSSLHPILDKVADKFKTIEDEEQKNNYRLKIQSYIKMYNYISQIINFEDIELEKTFVFLKYLNKKIPKPQSGHLDISYAIDLDLLQIQKKHEHIEDLLPEDSTVLPIIFKPPGSQIQISDSLLEIIKNLNNTYGLDLIEEDSVSLSHITEELVADLEVKSYMEGDSSEDNKKNHFNAELENMMVQNISKNLEFYKRVTDEIPKKGLIFEMMFEAYQMANKSQNPRHGSEYQ